VLLDRWDDAFADFQKALELNPFHFGALENMGHCRLNRGDPVAAMDYFRRAIEINPNLWDVYEALERAEAAAEKSRT
jgi:tetratricopeptide (TPR) repeat protein